jgi:hypothetical protein
LAELAFLIVPVDSSISYEGWESLDRVGRLDALHSQLADLGKQIQARLPAFELEFLEGLGGWTARSKAPTTRSELIEKLAGLPVEVAPEQRLYAV